MKKFRITKTIDTDKLNKEIERFECENRSSPYIFLNKETMDDLVEEIYTTVKNYYVCQPSSYCATYTGRKVFCDESLSYGEVELR